MVTIIANHSSELIDFITNHLKIKGHDIISLDDDDLETTIAKATKKHRHVGLLAHSIQACQAICNSTNSTLIKHLIIISPQPQDPDELSLIESAITLINCPKLFCHGTYDETIPHAETERLFKKATEPKELYLALDADHDFNISRHKSALASQINHWLSSIH